MVKKAFTENKEGNIKTVNNLIKDGEDREKELALIAKELKTFKEVAIKTINIILEKIPNKLEESTLADTLITSTTALINEYSLLQSKYNNECNENRRLIDFYSDKSMNSNFLQKDLGELTGFILFLLFSLYYHLFIHCFIFLFFYFHVIYFYSVFNITCFL